MTKQAKVTFEANGETVEFDLKAVRKLADYHQGQAGRFTDKERTALFVPAPNSPADFSYMLSKVAL
jgi:hypothetical protein